MIEIVCNFIDLSTPSVEENSQNVSAKIFELFVILTFCYSFKSTALQNISDFTALHNLPQCLGNYLR